MTIFETQLSGIMGLIIAHYSIFHIKQLITIIQKRQMILEHNLTFISQSLKFTLRILCCFL